MEEQDAVIQRLRAHVTEKLDELDGVVALRRTRQGTAPHFFRPGDDLAGLALDPRYPLAPVVSLLQKRYPEAWFGVVARGCDVRALVEMAKRAQVDVDRLAVVGVACSAEEAAECACANPAPDPGALPDVVVVGEPVDPAPPNPLVAGYEKMSLEEKRAFWRGQFVKCMKCYGCRDVCPECFCEACSLEDPLWVERGVLAPPFPSFHLIRAMHMASRCVACRQCELACPAHIPLTVLYDLVRRDVQEMLGYEPGADLDAPPPLAVSLEEAPVK